MLKLEMQVHCRIVLLINQHSDQAPISNILVITNNKRKKDEVKRDNFQVSQ
jgi:hypothetical protein